MLVPLGAFGQIVSEILTPSACTPRVQRVPVHIRPCPAVNGEPPVFIETIEETPAKPTADDPI